MWVKSNRVKFIRSRNLNGIREAEEDLEDCRHEKLKNISESDMMSLDILYEKKLMAKFLNN